jgi:hypothetical protein
MCSDNEILCRQPHRLLKRKLDVLDASQEERVSKCLLDFFLDSLPPLSSESIECQSFRCRSDSFLLQKMPKYLPSQRSASVQSQEQHPRTLSMAPYSLFPPSSTSIPPIPVSNAATSTTKQPTYRNILERYRIHIDAAGKDTPEYITAL